MADIDKTVESLYTHFLLRDLAGKIVPGTVLYVALASVFLPPAELLKAHSDLPLAATAILIAVLWVLGLAVQGIGSQLGLVRYSYKYPPPDKFHQAHRRFRDMRGDQKAEVQRYERFEAIREAFGNAAASIPLSLFIWLPGYLLNSGQSMTFIGSVLVVSAVLFTALLLGHRMTIKYFDAFWEHAITNRSDPESDDS
ncbi:MAG: hypothetical protein AAB068_04995 [Pseudomonadota bacterium]